MITNLYEILGINENATPTEIKTAYRQLARLYHPDKHPGKEDEYTKIFAPISKAYKVLNDFDSRKRYDEMGNINVINTIETAKSNIMKLYLKLIDEHGVDWLEQNDIVLFMINTITHNLRKSNIKLRQANKDRKYFEKLIDRITQKKTIPNLFNLVITQKLKQFTANIEILNLSVEVCAEGIKLLKEYKDTKTIVINSPNNKSSLRDIFPSFTSSTTSS